MTWTKYDELRFGELLAKREEHKEEVGKQVIATKLRELADSIENGSKPLYSIEVEYLRHEAVGYPRELGPVYGYRYILEIRNFNETVKTQPDQG